MLRTPCYGWHVSHGGRMVDFAGWEMSVQYSSIIEEHQAVRTAAGLFDIAHMGRLRFTGPDAGRFLDWFVTADVSTIETGGIRYGLVANETGGILDDVLVYRLESASDDDFYLMVVNASNRHKIVDWIETHRSGFEVTVDDVTLDQCMLAVQGPLAVDILNPLVETDISQMRYYTGTCTVVQGVSGIVSRTGYTGEDGFEVMLPAEKGPDLWQAVIDAGAGQGVLPAGLGCRDTLRLEAGMPLYGHELNENIDPFTAGLSFAVKLDAGDFIGKQSLVAAKANPNRRKRIGIELAVRRIAREEAELFAGDEPIGHVTSGTFSPTLQKSIAMAYVTAEFAKPGTEITVDIRGKREQATVVKLPFYRRG